MTAIVIGGLAGVAVFLVLAMLRDSARRDRAQAPVVLYATRRKEDDDGSN